MISAALLRNVLRIVLPLAVAATLYLYYYPVVLGCAFPLPPASSPSDSSSSAYLETFRQHVPFLFPARPDNDVIPATTADNSTADAPTPTPLVYSSRRAPFRLLALGDPQLEGDTSVPNAWKKHPLPHLLRLADHLRWKTQHPNLRQRMRAVLHDLVDLYFEDIPDTIESWRKQLDHWGNDLYLALIYRTIHWWTQPTHVTVLGDLVGSQWIDDKEFERRGARFWNIVFKGSERVPDALAAYPAGEYDLAGYLGVRSDNETAAWERRLINVAGNHDIGYAGDLTPERLQRFERLFGKANYELRFELPLSTAAAATVLSDETANSDELADRLTPELRIVVLNDMNLDTPALSAELQDQTYSFINDVITTSTAVEYSGHFTVLLTHVPLYKPPGVCVDEPFFAFFDDDVGGVREQNQLSADASRGFLEGIFGMSGDTTAAANGRGRPGVILNGHDHEGCDTFHFINQSAGAESDERPWEVKRWRQAKEAQIPGAAGLPGIREITVRSMMGGFGGYAGLLSGWFDEETWEWKVEYDTCAVGTHNVWWLVHILDLVAIGVAIAYPIAQMIERSSKKTEEKKTMVKVNGKLNGYSGSK